MTPHQKTENVKKICPFYAMGTCKYGRRCWNYHPLILDMTPGTSTSTQAFLSTSTQAFNEMIQPRSMQMHFHSIYGLPWPQFVPLNAAFGPPIQYPTGQMNGLIMKQPFPMNTNSAMQIGQALSASSDAIYNSGMAGKMNGLGLEQQFRINNATQTEQELTESSDKYAIDDMAGHINGLLNGLRLRQPFYMSKNSSMQTEQEITASSAICASEIGTSSVQITEIASTSTSSNNNTNGYQQPKTQDGNENLEEKDEDYYEYKIEMLELEVARLTKSEKKLRSEVERLCNVEESLEKLRIEFRQLDLRNWMWLKPILGEFLGCTFCTEIYIKPSVLSCNHMFCSWCIRTWMSRNSKCPTCRQEISFVTNCAELNEFILKSIESGDPDRRNEYLRISRERERDGGYRVIENSSDEEEDDSDDYSYYAY